MVPARGGQPARIATLSVRACGVTLDLRDKRHETHRAASLNVVCVTETAPPPGVAAVEWLLLTTAPVDSFEACVEVVRGYSLRRRIEMNQPWDSSSCEVYVVDGHMNLCISTPVARRAAVTLPLDDARRRPCQQAVGEERGATSWSEASACVASFEGRAVARVRPRRPTGATRPRGSRSTPCVPSPSPCAPSCAA